VEVGRHAAPEPEALDELLARFVQAYSSPILSKTQRIVSVGAGHRRLAWIHLSWMATGASPGSFHMRY
jgi:Fic family protein